jgi:recombination protein RecT
MSNLAILEKIDAIAFKKESRFMQALTQALPQAPVVLAPALVRQAITIIKGSEVLQKCSEFSLFNSIAEVAQAGLSLDLHLGQCYLVPFAGIATVIYGYRGLIELARRSGDVNEIVGEIRYEKDKFSISLGSNRQLVHVPADLPASKRGVRLGAYAIADMARSRPVFEYMTADEIERIKGAVIKRAKGKQTVWETENENEMWRKTPIRRLAKRLPQSPALIPFIQAAIRDEYRQQGIHQVVELPPLTNGGGESVPLVEVLREENVVEERQVESPRKSEIKESKPKPDAKISKEQVQKIYNLVADLNLESDMTGKCLKEIGHAGKLADLPADKFTALAQALEKRSKQ